MFEASIVERKQKSAPILSLSFTPKWRSNNNINLKDAWKETKFSSLLFGVTINMTPFLSSLVEQKNNYEKLESQNINKQYESCNKKQKDLFVQYKTLQESFSVQLKTAKEFFKNMESLLEDMKIQFEKGAISELQYEEMCVKKETLLTTVKIFELYEWLYDFLSEIYRVHI